MATIPTAAPGPRVQSGAGQVLAPPQPYMDAGIAGTAAGQGGAIGAALQQLGGDVRAAGNEFAAQALKEQALVNEAMVRDGASAADIELGNIYNEYATMEGEKAVAAKQGFMDRIAAVRKTSVDTMPSPEAKRMLDAVVTRSAGFYQGSIARYAASEQKKWQVRSAQGYANVQRDQAAVFRNVPELVATNIEAGAGSITSLGELNGWDKDTTTAEVARYRGGAYQGVISQLLSDGKVDEAARMFDSVRDRIDAGSQAQIAQALRPHQQKQQTQMDFATVGGAGPGTFTNIADAIMTQESGGRDGLVSVDGARGRMQIMPGTFAQWAKPGESIDNPADNAAVGQRMIAAYEQQYGGDPQRVAVAYFSGPGNVSEPGAPHPWKEDKKDGNGKSVSSYVKDITARLRKDTTGVPTYEAPDFGGMRERALSMWGDDPERLTRVLSRIGQAETQFNSTTKVERDGLNARLVNIEAALTNGREDVAIPETDIRRLYPKAQADGIVAKLGEVQQLGAVMREVALASPEEFRAKLAAYDDVAPGATGDLGPTYARRVKDREMLVRAWQQRGEQIKADPAVYAGRAPAVAALASPEALAAPGGPEAYARASLGEQERLGVPEAERRVLPKAAVASLVQKVMEADPEKVPAALVMGEIGKQYGAMWPAVYRDMVRSGLPAEYAVMGSMDAPGQVGARGAMQSALAFVAKHGAPALRDAAGDKLKVKDVDDNLDTALAPFHATADRELYTRVRSAVKTLSYWYARDASSGKEALDRAVAGVLGAKYDFDGTMRVPKGQLDLAREVTRGVQMALTDADLAPVADGPIAPEDRQNLARVANEGFWVPNADDTGLALMGRYRVAETGIPLNLPVKRAGGGNVEVKFEEMESLRNGQRARPAPSAGARSGVLFPNLRDRAPE